MAQAGQRKCLNCCLYFTPDRRVGDRQRYCSAGICQQVSKVRSQQRWLSQPHNHDYFRGPVHLARVQAWRAGHPDYARRAPGKPPLQDECQRQATDPEDKSGDRTLLPRGALQDLITASSPILAGLIAHLFQVTLQDEMAATTRRLVQLGTDILGGGEHGQTQADSAATARAARAPSIQLD
jgi:hypothetical protein